MRSRRLPIRPRRAAAEQAKPVPSKSRHRHRASSGDPHLQRPQGESGRRSGPRGRGIDDGSGADPHRSPRSYGQEVLRAPEADGDNDGWPTLHTVSVPVPLDELATALDRRANTAYLLTVGEHGRVHCVASTLAWTDGELVVPAGTTSRRNAAARGSVVLLSPPVPSPGSQPAAGADDELDAYSLIVDGEVSGASRAESGTGGQTEGTVRVRPTHAVFHRPAPPHNGGHGHDCVHVYEAEPPARGVTTHAE